MLSYQHIYHAGNLADVQKHALLAWALDYMTRKDKPITYIETHAGRGVYDLTAPEAEKTGEAAAGIAALAAAFPPDHPYARRLAETRAMYGETFYPGSPLIAALSLRDGDVIHLAELHPQERAALQVQADRWGAHVRAEDGLKMALAITPPTPRRGFLLIDPSYEVKEDYATIPRVIGQVARKWNVGTIMLWYPILTSRAHEAMLATLMADHPESFRHELRFPPVRDGHKMVGSGVWMLNPPYGIGDEAARLDRLFRKV